MAALAAELAKAGETAREKGWEIKSAGIGVPGRVLPGEGRVVPSPNTPALNDCRLIDRLAPQVNFPLSLENDANLFALGEHWLGAGKGHDQMLGITLGTGVGGGLILNGRLWAGTQGTSGEIGHLTMDPEGTKCHCGNRGLPTNYGMLFSEKEKACGNPRNCRKGRFRELGDRAEASQDQGRVSK